MWPKQLEKNTVIRHFAVIWSTSARVDFYSLERQLGPTHGAERISAGCGDRRHALRGVPAPLRLPVDTLTFSALSVC